MVTATIFRRVLRAIDLFGSNFGSSLIPSGVISNARKKSGHRKTEDDDDDKRSSRPWWWSKAGKKIDAA